MNGRKWKLLFLKKMNSNEEFGMLCVVCCVRSFTERCAAGFQLTAD